VKPRRDILDLQQARRRAIGTGHRAALCSLLREWKRQIFIAGFSSFDSGFDIWRAAFDWVALKTEVPSRQHFAGRRRRR
jgi:hypothetical protein